MFAVRSVRGVVGGVRVHYFRFVFLTVREISQFWLFWDSAKIGKLPLSQTVTTCNEAVSEVS